MRYIWCALCHETAVLHSGDVCGHCMGEIEAVVYPDWRAPIEAIRRPPLVVRFLLWLTGAVSAPR